MTKEEKDAPKTEEGKETSQPQPNGNINRNWVDQYYEELNHALHRFNYFLIAVSFMFVAFVTLITSCKSSELDWVILAIASAGIALSFYFFQINYQQTRVACIVRDQKRNTPVDKEDENLETVRWICESFKDTARYVCRFRFIARERPASHTWIVPVLFILLWVFSLVGWLIS